MRVGPSIQWRLQLIVTSTTSHWHCRHRHRFWCHIHQKKARGEAKDTAAAHLCQHKEDNLRSGNVTKDNHGKKFVSNNDKFIEASAQENKTKARAVAMMEVQGMILNKEEAYDEYACYDGSTATMESCDNKVCKERSSGPIGNATYKDKVTYEEEFTNYTYERNYTYECAVAY